MAASTTIEIDGVGPVLFERSKRAKHIGITIRAFRGIRVAVPAGVSFSDARRFTLTRIDWLRKHTESMRRYENDMKSLPAAFNAINRAEARRFLTARLKQLSKEHGFVYRHVSIRNQRTRWGSCSHRNDISLNMKLLALPDDLIDYVILHELVHTAIPNHGKKFWAVLDRHAGGAKALAARLRKYEPGAAEPVLGVTSDGKR